MKTRSNHMEKVGSYYKYHFTEENDRYIRENYLTTTNKDMATFLEVGLTSLRNHMYQVLKLRRFAKWEKWSKDQEKYITDNYQTTSDAEMMQFLNENLPRNDGRLITRDMIEKKRSLLNLHRTPEQVTALYQTPYLQKKMATISTNSASVNKHRNWVACIIAGRNTDLRKEIMENPDKYQSLIEIKRLQIELNQTLKQKPNDNSNNSELRSQA